MLDRSRGIGFDINLVLFFCVFFFWSAEDVSVLLFCEACFGLIVMFDSEKRAVLRENVEKNPAQKFLRLLYSLMSGLWLCNRRREQRGQ